MTDKVLTATWSRGPYVIKAEWHGGIYVEITYPEIADATDAMNVQDSLGNRPPFTQEALEAELNEWCEDLYGESTEDGLHKLHAQIVNNSY